MSDQLGNFVPIFVGFLGLLVVIFIISYYKRSAIFNVYLLLLFLIISFRLVHIGAVGIYDLSLFNSYVSYLGPIYLFGIPLVYLYFESLYADSLYFNPKHLWHLVFPLANMLLNGLQLDVLALNTPLIEFIQVYSILAFIVCYSIAIIYLSYKNLWHKARKSIVLSSIHESKMMNWALFLLIILVLLSFRLVYSIYSEIQGDTRILGYNGALLKSIIWFIVFVKILMSPELLYGYPKLKPIGVVEDDKPITKSALWTENISEIKSTQDAKLNETIDVKITSYLRDIEDYVSLHHPFRNNTYTIKDLAKGLQVPVSHLAYVFKYHCEMSFVEFRNHHRIKDALHLISINFLDAQTFEALAVKVGFSSYNSFFVSFKRYTGASPKDYLQH
ncbi:helix-turn-helix domain-containing protein [uncultured Winogradskyella sp.]|uniref:helix-turn-helix domain-containing protein n=1 Tax=uncultured Winogradskyella sp. TaxID=395353 RepID=UPI0030D7F018